MTLSYAYRCDICGECVYIPLDRPTDAIPDDWATLTIKHPNEPERAYKGHICAICAKALESGESVEIYKTHQQYEDLKRDLDRTTPIIRYSQWTCDAMKEAGQ